MSETNETKLLTIREGETKEEAIKRWWQDFGLDVETTRANRNIEYKRQKGITLEELKRVAVRMNRMGPAEDV